MSIYQLTQSSMVYVIGICEQEREWCDGIVALLWIGDFFSFSEVCALGNERGQNTTLDLYMGLRLI